MTTAADAGRTRGELTEPLKSSVAARLPEPRAGSLAFSLVDASIGNIVRAARGYRRDRFDRLAIYAAAMRYYATASSERIRILTLVRSL